MKKVILFTLLLLSLGFIFSGTYLFAGGPLNRHVENEEALPVLERRDLSANNNNNNSAVVHTATREIKRSVLGTLQELAAECLIKNCELDENHIKEIIVLSPENAQTFINHCSQDAFNEFKSLFYQYLSKQLSNCVKYVILNRLDKDFCNEPRVVEALYALFKQVVDEKNPQKDAVLLACCIVEKLYTENNDAKIPREFQKKFIKHTIKRLAELGPITYGLAEINAKTWSLYEMIEYEKGNYYTPAMLAHGNEELFRKAFIDNYLSFLKNKVIYDSHPNRGMYGKSDNAPIFIASNGVSSIEIRNESNEVVRILPGSLPNEHKAIAAFNTEGFTAILCGDVLCIFNLFDELVFESKYIFPYWSTNEDFRDQSPASSMIMMDKAIPERMYFGNAGEIAASYSYYHVPCYTYTYLNDIFIGGRGQETNFPNPDPDTLEMKKNEERRVLIDPFWLKNEKDTLPQLLQKLTFLQFPTGFPLSMLNKYHVTPLATASNILNHPWFEDIVTGLDERILPVILSDSHELMELLDYIEWKLKAHEGDKSPFMLSLRRYIDKLRGLIPALQEHEQRNRLNENE